MTGARDKNKRQERCMGVSVRNSEGQRPLGRTGNRLEDNIAISLQEVAWGGTDLIDLDQNRDKEWALVNALVNRRVP
jgi:hypothetical protein